MHHFGRPFVKRFAVCYRTVVLSVCLNVTFTMVYCGQTVGWVRMSIGTEVGLGPGHIVFDGDPAPPMERGRAAPTFEVYERAGLACVGVIRGRCLLWPDGWMDQDAASVISVVFSRLHFQAGFFSKHLFWG